MTRHRLAVKFRSSIGGAVAIVAWTFHTPTPVHAYWCANYHTGGTNCGFSSFAQCQAAVSGAGGVCNEIRDGASSGPAREPRRAAKPPPKQKPAPREIAAPAVTRAPATSTPAATAVPATQPLATQTPATQMPATQVPAIGQKTAPGFTAARQLVLNGQHSAGLTALQALQMDDNPDVAAYIGLAHKGLGRPDDARSWYERALAADPNHKLALSFYGFLQVESGNIQGAQANLVRIGRLCGNTSCNEYQALQAVIAAKIR